MLIVASKLALGCWEGGCKRHGLQKSELFGFGASWRAADRFGIFHSKTCVMPNPKRVFQVVGKRPGPAELCAIFFLRLQSSTKDA